YDLPPGRWPAGLDLTIAAVADIHACQPWMSEERIGAIVDRTNELGADLIVLLGDYVGGHRYVTSFVEPRLWAAELARLKAPLGVHAIMGNHDWWSDRTAQRTGQGPTRAQRALERAGIKVCAMDAVQLRRPDRPFWLAVRGDQFGFWASGRRFPNRRTGVDDLTGTLAKVTDDAPLILLAHEPDIAVRVSERVSLMLSGH